MPIKGKKSLSYTHTFKWPWMFLNKIVVALLGGKRIQSSRTTGYWNGLPFRSVGGLPIPGLEPASRSLPDIFVTTQPPGKPS